MCDEIWKANDYLMSKKSLFLLSSQAKNDARLCRASYHFFRNTLNLMDSIIIWPKLVEPHVNCFGKHVIF